MSDHHPLNTVYLTDKTGPTYSASRGIQPPTQDIPMKSNPHYAAAISMLSGIEQVPVSILERIIATDGETDDGIRYTQRLQRACRLVELQQRPALALAECERELLKAIESAQAEAKFALLEYLDTMNAVCLVHGIAPVTHNAQAMPRRPASGVESTQPANGAALASADGSTSAKG